MIVCDVITLAILKPRFVDSEGDIASEGLASHGVASPGFLNQRISAEYRARRAALMVAIIAAHLMLAAWILSSGSNFAGARPTPILAAIDISKDVPEPEAPAKPAIVPPVPDDHMAALLPSKLMVEMAPPVAGNGTGRGCSVASAVSAALIADKAAMAELATLPAEVRSEADAVMLWNGAWLDHAPEAQMQMAQSPIPALKRAVIDAVLALPAECQEVETAGPQLISVPEPGRTTMVVIGSGVWRWSNLLDPPIEPDKAGLADQSVGDWLASFGLTGN